MSNSRPPKPTRSRSYGREYDQPRNRNGRDHAHAARQPKQRAVPAVPALTPRSYCG